MARQQQITSREQQVPSPDSWSPVLDTTLTGGSLVDALLGGTQWDTHLLSFSFPDENSPWSTDPDTGYGPATGDGEPWQTAYEGLGSGQRDGVIAALRAWGSVADLELQQVDESATVVGDLRFAFTGRT